MCEGGEREFGQHENCSMKKWKNQGGFENYVRIIIERSGEGEIVRSQNLAKFG